MTSLKKIAIFDTSIATDNIGDEIIMDAVLKHARTIFGQDFFIRIPTHDRIGPKARKIARESHVSLVGGTNLLCANWLWRNQWKVGLWDFWRVGHPVLMGVGWQFYQRPSDPATAMMLRAMLSKTHNHSVRDRYTEQRMHAMGIKNVINTGCPTMWNLTDEHCASIQKHRAENALITVTAYRGDPQDRQWIDLVLAKYKHVYFWPQMFGDMQYINDIAGDRVTVLDASLVAYDNALKNNNVDFIGTRLHGGVRALQHGRRALIIEVDNRAAEIARDTKLPTVKRGDTDTIASWINGGQATEITMPWKEIARWKAQFKG